MTRRNTVSGIFAFAAGALWLLALVMATPSVATAEGDGYELPQPGDPCVTDDGRPGVIVFIDNEPICVALDGIASPTPTPSPAVPAAVQPTPAPTAAVASFATTGADDAQPLALLLAIVTLGLLATVGTQALYVLISRRES